MCRQNTNRWSSQAARIEQAQMEAERALASLSAKLAEQLLRGNRGRRADFEKL